MWRFIGGHASSLPSLRCKWCMVYTGSFNHPVTVLAWLSVWSEVPQPPSHVFLHHKSRMVFAFLVPAHPRCPGKEPVRWVFVCYYCDYYQCCYYLLVSRSSVGKWFAQSRAVAFLVPGFCLLLFAILITVSNSVASWEVFTWSPLMHVFNECTYGTETVQVTPLRRTLASSP